MKKTNWVYAEKEMKYMKMFHNLKWYIFSPFMKILNRLWITANHITIFWGIIVLLFFILSYLFLNPLYFLVGIWLHMFFDGIDGVLARYNNSMSDYGSLLDVIFDHLWIFLTSVYLLIFMGINSVLVLSYTVFYTIIIYNSFILWKIDRPYSFVFRPRLFIYTSIVIDFFYNTNITYVLLMILTFILFIQSIQWLYYLLLYFKNK